MHSRISSVKSTSTVLVTNISGNIGCQPHDKVGKKPVRVGKNMNLSYNVPATQDVADNLEGNRHDYNLSKAPSNRRTHNNFTNELEEYIFCDCLMI